MKKTDNPYPEGTDEGYIYDVLNTNPEIFRDITWIRNQMKSLGCSHPHPLIHVLLNDGCESDGDIFERVDVYGENSGVFKYRIHPSRWPSKTRVFWWEVKEKIRQGAIDKISSAVLLSIGGVIGALLTLLVQWIVGFWK